MEGENISMVENCTRQHSSIDEIIARYSVCVRVQYVQRVREGEKGSRFGFNLHNYTISTYLYFIHHVIYLMIVTVDGIVCGHC